MELPAENLIGAFGTNTSGEKNEREVSNSPRFPSCGM